MWIILVGFPTFGCLAVAPENSIRRRNPRLSKRIGRRLWNAIEDRQIQILHPTGVYGLTHRDRAMASSAYTHAGIAPNGEAIEWSNPCTGNRGRIVALREGIFSLGSYCPEFSQSVSSLTVVSRPTASPVRKPTAAGSWSASEAAAAAQNCNGRNNPVSGSWRSLRCRLFLH